MIDAKSKWFSSMNQDKSPVLEFMRENIQVCSTGKISRTDLRTAFINWAEREGRMMQGFDSAKRFKNKIQELYPSIFGIEYSEVKTNGVSYYTGIQLINYESEESDDE